MRHEDVLDLLRSRPGNTVEEALLAAESWDPDGAVPAPHQTAAIRSPDASWLRRANVVGINLRTVGGAWGAVPYSLTLPAVQDTIHLLPFLEPGVVGSLYGPASWEVDQTLFDPVLAQRRPGLDTVEKQLHAVVNLLHATGRRVGLDVIPHCDRFAEMVLAQPDHFEWVQRSDRAIIGRGSAVVAKVERLIHAWLAGPGAGDGPPLPMDPDELFRTLDEETRLRALFGARDDLAGRRARRTSLIRILHANGLETLPATMGPPYRGLELDPSSAALSVDAMGLAWREYRISQAQPMSRVFGPLTRYSLYEPSSEGANELDFGRPREHVWRYVTEHYADIASRFGFDFMRGDMSHVQMRPTGVPTAIDKRYDILGAVRDEIRDVRRVQSFGFLAESFLAPPGTMAYGDEMDHLEAAGADTALGDLQSTPLGSPEFCARFRRYLDYQATRTCTPSFTIMTADKDDPRFDSTYVAGSAARLFIALLVPDLPSYMALGFELRDVRDRPGPSEHYSKHYVFQVPTGIAATRGPYVFGSNVTLFATIERIRLLAESIREDLLTAMTVWTRPPDATGQDPSVAWVIDSGPARRHLCIVNMDSEHPLAAFGVPRHALIDPPARWLPVFSTEASEGRLPALRSNGHQWIVDSLRPGECRAYRSDAD